MVGIRFQLKQMVIVLPMVLLSACFSGVKAVPEDLRPIITPNLTFQEVIMDPAASVGKTVLVGGVILQTTVYEGGTILEVIQKPLGRRDRPLETDQSAGRFLVEKAGQFLDPGIYKEGREITIVGEIIKEEKKPLGEMEYRYPYLSAAHIHLWQERSEPAHYYSYCRSPFVHDCYDPFYPPYFYRGPFIPYPYGAWPYRSPFFPRHFPHRHPPAEKTK